MKKKSRVIIAMSGGVDSSVTTALLKKEGFDVVGIFMKFWTESGNSRLCYNRCCAPESEKRAREVASILGIPFYVLNFEKEFKKRIVDYFLEEYEKGVTPNPCVICNKEIKFGLLFEKALALRADFVATGHYARIKEENRKSHLLAARDKNKDQSYFLWMLNQKQLKRVLLPIGGYLRSEVEEMAKSFKLPFDGVKKSQEVCFIQGTAADFLKRHIKEKPGKIITQEGKEVGEHRGLWLYTIGQRKGINLSGGPYYVADKDLKRNYLIVSKNEKDLFKKELLAKKINWISGKEPALPLKVKVKIRYRSQLVAANIIKTKNKNLKLVFDNPQRAITPGQSAVFYDSQKLLGGGIIVF